MKPNKTNIIFIILIIITGFSVYFNSLNGKFIWDDEILVRDNVTIKNWSNIGKIFTQDIGAGGDKEYHFYRPLQVLTYMSDYSIWKLNVIGYHLTNIILHILVALSIYWLIFILFKDKLLSFFVSMLFVVHPIHTEAVDYISGGADLLVALFILLSFIFYIKILGSRKGIFYCVLSLAYIFALLSKEYSLILPLVLIFYHYAFKINFKIKVFLPVLLVTFLYILLRITLLSSLTFYQFPFSITFWQRLPGVFSALTNYIQLLLLPFNLHMEYGIRLFKFTDIRAIFGVLILIALLCSIFKKRKIKGPVFFAAGWFLLLLLPQSNIFAINAYMAEHWLYLPSVGFFLTVGYGLTSLYRVRGLKVITIVFLATLLVFYSFLTIKQNQYWKDPLTFFERNLKYTPDSVRVLNSLAKAYKDTGKNKEAIALYKKAIAINPDYIDSFNNLGLAYFDIGNYPEAKDLFKRVIAISPKYARAYNNLANIYKETGNPQEAVALYKKAIEINPDFADAYNNLGIVLYTVLQQKNEAITAFKKAIEINPDFADAHNNLAVAYYYVKQYSLAIKHCDIAIKLGYKVDDDFLKLLKPFH